MGLISKLNPVGGFQDFWQEFRRPTPYRWPALFVSILLTSGLFYLIAQEDEVGLPQPYTITYISTLPPNRTEEEIIASNIENQKRADRLEAALAASEERKKEIYRSLARASGIDTTEIEREVAEEKAQKEAEQAAAVKKALSRSENKSEGSAEHRGNPDSAAASNAQATQANNPPQ